ncbi:redox-sensitive transcriptional activator SoxR [Plantactinospora sp. GCM10030261]|uniref:redox-sensitive transcriptional activator SoxR n=1 Tax=Plantactinospora sp. GCM10030261 TaxID=3273420 RepID=UPI003622E536
MSKEPDDELTIGDVVRRTGVAASALHYYEQLGLISTNRTAGNQRRYPRHMLRRVSLILVAKRLGIGLADVSEVFATLPMDSIPTARDWKRVSRRWQIMLEARKREIEQLQRELTGCIGCGCLSMEACRLLNPEDELGTQGPGPRRLDARPDRSGRARSTTPRHGSTATEQQERAASTPGRGSRRG